MEVVNVATSTIFQIRTAFVNVKFNRARCNEVVRLCNVIDEEIKRIGPNDLDNVVFRSLVETLKECREFLLKVSTSGFAKKLWRSSDIASRCDFFVTALEKWLRWVDAKIPVAEKELFLNQDAEFNLATMEAEDRLKKAKRIAAASSLGPKSLAVATIERSDIQVGRKIDDSTLGVVHEGLFKRKRVYIRLLAEQMEPQVLEIAKMGVLLNKQLKDCTNILPIHGICDGRIVVTDASSFGPLNKFQYDLSVLDKIDIAIKIAAAVYYIHELNVAPEVKVIHRDIRACNVLLDDGLEPMLTGFELSREIKDPTGGQEVEEHVRYWWSPERESDGSSRQSDVYSFGILMYEISMRKEPETGDPKVLMEEEVNTTDPEYSILMGECLGPWNRRPTMREVSERLLSIQSGIARNGEAPLEP